jgi:hypothetical protein
MQIPSSVSKDRWHYWKCAVGKYPSKSPPPSPATLKDPPSPPSSPVKSPPHLTDPDSPKSSELSTVAESLTPAALSTVPDPLKSTLPNVVVPMTLVSDPNSSLKTCTTPVFAQKSTNTEVNMEMMVLLEYKISKNEF